ncbi:MAG TPA: YMGG-like glycine zipper-containing protein [Acetobacteraceae bacterium]|nr:YMGG-like glycine zipper-containing protein [Acetobacteraceae bacterium]
MKRLIVPCALAVGASVALSACNPYDPGQRAVSGGLIGAGTGAAIGGAAGGGHGAAVGALVGGAVGAVAGAATTPTPPRPRAYYRPPPPPVYYYPY